MEHIDVLNLSLATLGAEIFRFVIQTTDLKDPVKLCVMNAKWERTDVSGG